MNFAEQYRDLLGDCLAGVEDMNRRTGKAIRMMSDGASFALDLSDNVLPTCGLRLTRPHVAAAENAWCLLGHNHVDWLRRHAKVWDAFADVATCAECDGMGDVTDRECAKCGGTGKTHWLEQAYGNRWKNAFGYDQLDAAMKRLITDPSDRRVWISSWDPTLAGDLAVCGQRTVPCPVGFTLSIMNGRLCSTLMIRSSDLYHGLPYDVMRHAFLMAAVGESLLRELGHMRVTLAHPHLYESQWESARDMLRLPTVVPLLKLPDWSVGRVVGEPDYYVETYKAYAASREFAWPSFNPKIEVAR